LRLLVDSNVIVAAFVQEHVHHQASARLLNEIDAAFVVAAHSLAEAYYHLSRPERVFVELEPTAVAALLESLIAATEQRALAAEEMMTAITHFAASGGRGARLYDYLIGYSAVLERVDALVTWNVRHFVALFPTMRIATPRQILES